MQISGQSGYPDIFRALDRVPDNQFNGTARRDQDTPPSQFFDQRDCPRALPAGLLLQMVSANAQVPVREIL